MKSAAIIYARTNSKRFPEKCFIPLGASCLPLVHWVVLRSEALDVDSLVFATTDKDSDDKLVNSIEDLRISNLTIFVILPNAVILPDRGYFFFILFEILKSNLVKSVFATF